MRIYPAVHYTMGGLWVDYNLMSNIPGLHIIGEANFSDHGANRLGASALMQGLADGYLCCPTPCELSRRPNRETAVTDHTEFKRVESEVRARVKKLLESMETALLPHSIVSWTVALEKCGMARNAIALREALEKIPELRDEF